MDTKADRKGAREPGESHPLWIRGSLWSRLAMVAARKYDTNTNREAILAIKEYVEKAEQGGA